MDLVDLPKRDPKLLDLKSVHPAQIPKLDESQLRDFDTEYVTPEIWTITEQWITEAFPDGQFSFLDVGGGNGAFTDLLLNRFPGARGVLIDNGEALLSINKPHPRKTTLCESALDIERRFKGQHFDLICFNWLLHHLVLRSYRSTCALQARIVAAARDLLSKQGRLCVFENLYDGILVDALPGWVTYQLTSSEILSPIVKRLGANTAGCGVCFRSRSGWEALFLQLGLDIKHFQMYGHLSIGKLRRVALHIRSARMAAFLLEPIRS
jgi:SAM-dependent methyltransferase